MAELYKPFTFRIWKDNKQARLIASPFSNTLLDTLFFHLRLILPGVTRVAVQYVFISNESTMLHRVSNPILLFLLIRIFYFVQIMDDRWETEVIEYGAINITGFRIVDSSRRYVKDFLEGWRKLDPIASQGAGRDSISVGLLALCQWQLCWHTSTTTEYPAIQPFGNYKIRFIAYIYMFVSAPPCSFFFLKVWGSKFLLCTK
jgi:Receptor family ligand binding region.